VNLFAEEIARGEMRAALIVGGEALRTQFHGERASMYVGTKNLAESRNFSGTSAVDGAITKSFMGCAWRSPCIR
jgi:hypothetical protein